MGGIMGIAVGIFGVVWTILAVSMGAGFMGIFGIVFVFIAIAQAVYNFKNATGENRYSEFDIVDSYEESDPLNERFGNSTKKTIIKESLFCPYCGSPVSPDFSFCNKCGKELP